MNSNEVLSIQVAYRVQSEEDQIRKSFFENSKVSKCLSELEFTVWWPKCWNTSMETLQIFLVSQAAPPIK